MLTISRVVSVVVAEMSYTGTSNIYSKIKDGGQWKYNDRKVKPVGVGFQVYYLVTATIVDLIRASLIQRRVCDPTGDGKLLHVMDAIDWTSICRQMQ